MKKLIGLLRLMRPANIVTAVTDILAGVAISGSFFERPLFNPDFYALILSTIGLYGGGVVLNDVFDAALDAVERPERPIPSGVVKRAEGAALGIVLLIVGIASALYVGLMSGAIALSIATASVVYDKWGKHHSVFGPLNMGLCRGLNLVLGISIIPSMVYSYGYLSIVPILYIAAITLISRGEVHGGKKWALWVAFVLYLMVMACIYTVAGIQGNLWTTGALVLLWAVLVFVPLFKAIELPVGKNIGKAVKAGILALIVMDAAWVSAFSAPQEALGMLLLLPFSLILARLFAVT